MVYVFSLKSNWVLRYNSQGINMYYQNNKPIISAYYEVAMKKKFSFFSLQMIFILFVASHVSASPIDVVVSIAPQKWLVEQIGGNLVSISILIG